MLEFLIRAYLSEKGISLPTDPNFTLAAADPAGRVDVAASAALQMYAGANPIANAMFNVFKPVIDGALTEQLGPARLTPIIDQYVPEEMQQAYQAVTKELVIRGSK